jgi:hypothetical protein
MILDALTVLFIVAGLALVWLNLRERHLRKVIIGTDGHDGCDPDGDELPNIETAPPR